MKSYREGRRRALAVVASALAVVALCVMIFLLSAQPAANSDGTSLRVVELVARLVVPGYDALPEGERLALASALNHPVRKLAHFSEYAILGILVCNLVVQLARKTAWDMRTRKKSCERAPVKTIAVWWGDTVMRLGSAHSGTRRKGMLTLALIAWMIATLYAASDEVHQAFVPGRACMLGDVLIDSAGVFFGVSIVMGIYCVRKHVSRKNKLHSEA